MPSGRLKGTNLRWSHEKPAAFHRAGGAFVTAWQFNPELTFEKVGDDWLVLNPDAAVMLRASGPAAEVLTATAAASPAPAHLADAAAALAERGVLVEDAAPGMSRRRLISTGALAAGAATLAAAAGIHTLVLPTAAAAASTLAAPTGVTATAMSDSRIDVNWALVSGATSYQVYFKAASGSTFNTFGGPVSNGPVAVTGLQPVTTYNFYVTATDGTLTSAGSVIVNQTTFFPN